MAAGAGTEAVRAAKKERGGGGGGGALSSLFHGRTMLLKTLRLRGKAGRRGI